CQNLKKRSSPAEALRRRGIFLFLSVPASLRDKSEDVNMNVNCQEHRKSMELMGLRLRLKQEGLEEQEKAAILERIKILEKELEVG
ncbi:MAG: hypothetical protein ACQEQ7_14735, partial [Thermodesulfobacteriota bacterium]